MTEQAPESEPITLDVHDSSLGVAAAYIDTEDDIHG